MSISRKYLKSKPICKVTFRISKAESQVAETAEIVGEFNDWTPTEMKKLKSGDFKTILDLPVAGKYAFRYLLNGETWINDEEADILRPNGFGSEQNGVLVL